MQLHESYLGVNGRFTGSYVYIFMCEHLNQAVIKIGVSDYPLKRLDQIRQACPFRVLTFATVNIYTRKVAFKIEAELLHKFEKWKTRGEWLSFKPEDKPIFNATLRTVLGHYKKQGWPLNIVKSPVTAKMQEVLPSQKRKRRSVYADIREVAKRCVEDLGFKDRTKGMSVSEQSRFYDENHEQLKSPDDCELIRTI